MKRTQRRRYSTEYKRQLQQLETRYIASLYKAMLTQIDDFLSTLRNSGLEAAKASLHSQQINTDIYRVIKELYIKVGLFYAKQTDKEIKEASKLKARGRFGRDDEWISRINKYLEMHLLSGAVVPIAETTREQIRRVLIEATNNGWGIDEISKRLESKELTFWRAQLITRTELVKAASVGKDVAVESVPFKMNKEWISSGDDRVRPAHEEIDGTIIPQDEDFDVGGERMSGPGDPSASAENICNCRCTLAYVPARDADGRLVMKSNHELPTNVKITTI